MRYIDRKQKTKLLIDGLITFLIFSAIIISGLIIFDYEGFINFAEKNFTSDGFISYEIKSVIRLYSAMLYVLILLLLIRFFNPVKVEIKSLIVKIVYVAALFLLVFHYFSSDIYFIFGEDRLMESLTVVLAVISSGIFLFLGNKQSVLSEKILFFLLSGLMLIFAMEEISWGQRILGLATPELFKKINIQNEINIHNIFNFMIVALYVVVLSMIASIFLFREQLIKKIRKSSFFVNFEKIVPSTDYYYFGHLFLFLAGYSLFRGGELPEEIFSIFIFVYALDLLFKLKNKLYPFSK